MALIKPSARQVKFCVTGAEHTHPGATYTDPGFMAPADKVKLDGLGGGGDYVLPVATNIVLGGIKSGGDVIVGIDGTVTLLVGGGTEEGYIQDYIGKSAGDVLPAYTSVLVVDQNDNLTIAIGKIDADRGVDVITNTIVDSTQTINENIQDISVYVENSTLQITLTNISTTTTIDAVIARFVAWDILVNEGATKAYATKVMALHDGTTVEFNDAGALILGGNITGLDINVILTGGNTLELQVTSTPAVNVVTRRITTVP